MEQRTPRLMVSALSSGSGKTTVTCGLLRAALDRGLRPCAFKCGPDYIDPMFHRSVLGVPSRNLDLFFSREEAVCQSLASASFGHDLAVMEGVMGCFDGVAGTTRASSWHLAVATATPMVLVVRPGGSSTTLAAMIQGVCRFRAENPIEGVILNQCGEKLASKLTPIIEQETGVKVFGFLPKLEGCALPSRHLGLYTPGEIQDLSAILGRVARQMEETVDLDGLFTLAASAPQLVWERKQEISQPGPHAPVVAVARDEAFCFYYPDNLELLEQNGLSLREFSPLRDQRLPEGTCGVYLGGGYPELYTRQLSENRSLLAQLRAMAEAGMPMLGECGGFLYLQQSLEDPEGNPWPMAGVLEGRGYKTGRLQRFGYVTLRAEEENTFLRRGEQFPAHEFHRWDCTENGAQCRALRPNGETSWNCMTCKGNILAGFPHLYYPAIPQLPARFAQACAQYQEEHL